MKLYLPKETKVTKGGFGSGGGQVGASRGGNYVARVQMGYEKDNSPRYRYFKTLSEYKDYLKRLKARRKKDSKEKDDSDDSSASLKDSDQEAKRPERRSSKKRSQADRQSLFVKK